MEGSDFSMEYIREVLLRVAARNEVRITEQNAWILLSMCGNDQTIWHTFVHCAEEERLLLVYLLCPGTVPQEKHTQAMEIITRVNAPLKYGSFVFGEEEGEIRLRISQFIPTTLTGDDADDFVHRILGIAVRVADACLPKLLPVLTSWEGIDVPD